ncbi:MAG: hypothetical protein U5K43_00055 [Halofilum sp. (in: g-proteobacteria)]|nr:hypothetical protein [Halofilum sp. (in: g-proteobacteria)]
MPAPAGKVGARWTSDDVAVPVRVSSRSRDDCVAATPVARTPAGGADERADRDPPRQVEPGRSGLDDHERPLAQRGREARRPWASACARAAPCPSAWSARTRCARATRRPPWPRPPASTSARLLPEPRLYTADAAAVLAVVRRLDDGLGRVAIVGHNPALHELVHTLSDLRLDKLPTGGRRAPALRRGTLGRRRPGKGRGGRLRLPKSGRG